MINKRKLTGQWYLKKTWLGTYRIMVETTSKYWHDPSFGNGCREYSPEITKYVKALPKDLIELDIIII